MGAVSVLLAVFAGGVPVALVGLGWAARTRQAGIRWSRKWAAVFQIGFIFQLSSILLTSALLLAMLLAGEGSVFATVLFVFSLVLSAFGLRAWRLLQAAVIREMPQRITA